MPAGRLFTVAVVPTSAPDAFFHEYLTVPLAPVTVPAVTVPSCWPQVASVLLDAPNASVDAGTVIVTEFVCVPQSSVTVKL